jgi:RNA polymerase sigma factor (sigma-70 family)
MTASTLMKSTPVRASVAALTEAWGLPTGESLDWAALYAELRHDPNNAVAFGALARRVARWAERQLTSPACRPEREDVVAETCAAVVLALDEAHGPGTFAGFVYGHYQNARRRALQNARQPVVPLGDIDLPDAAPEGPTADEPDLLARCLAELVPRERRAVELRYFEDASAMEMAEALGVTETNARQLVFCGLARLRHSARLAWPRGRG